MNRQSALLRPAHLLHRLAPGDVHDHDGNADHLGMTDGAMRGFALDRLWPRHAVIIGRDMALAFQLGGQETDGVVTLAMDHHQRLLAARDLEDFEQLLVTEHEVVIGHEHLERGVAVLDQRRQLLPEHDRGRIGNDEMERRVDIALAFGELAVVLDAGPQRRALLLKRKREDHGVAAGGCRTGRRGEVVGHHHVGAGGLRDVDMAIDPARQRQQPGRVDLAGSTLDMISNADDAAVANADIGAKLVASRHDGAAANGEVELRHRSLRHLMTADVWKIRPQSARAPMSPPASSRVRHSVTATESSTATFNSRSSEAASAAPSRLVQRMTTASAPSAATARIMPAIVAGATSPNEKLSRRPRCRSVCGAIPSSAQTSPIRRCTSSV